MLILFTTIWDFFKSEYLTLIPSAAGSGISLGININTISVAISCLVAVVGLCLSISNYSLKRKIMRKEYENLLKDNHNE